MLKKHKKPRAKIPCFSKMRPEIGKMHLSFVLGYIFYEEGRGKLLSPLRLDRERFLQLSPASQSLLNRNVYRTEGEWLEAPEAVHDQNRMILITLRPDNMEEYERQGAISVLRKIEALDERYYSVFPAFSELAELYGDPCNEKLYGIRDLHYHYRTRYLRDHNNQIYDVTDERQSGSRRF